MSNQPNYLDLDAIGTEISLVVKLDGKDHQLQAISVDDFVTNLQIVQKMGTDVTVDQEIDLLVDMLSRAFPTIPKERLRKLTLPQLNALMSKAKEFNGQNAVTDEVKEKLKSEGAENPPKPMS
jgi:hypothetical protein